METKYDSVFVVSTGPLRFVNHAGIIVRSVDNAAWFSTKKGAIKFGAEKTSKAFEIRKVYKRL